MTDMQITDSALIRANCELTEAARGLIAEMKQPRSPWHAKRVAKRCVKKWNRAFERSLAELEEHHGDEIFNRADIPVLSSVLAELDEVLQDLADLFPGGSTFYTLRLGREDVKPLKEK